MNELRWILLIAGLALIVALYLVGSRHRQRNPVEFERPTRVDPPRPAPPEEASRLEPRMSLDEVDADLEMAPQDDDVIPEPSRAAVPPPVRREPALGGPEEPDVHDVRRRGGRQDRDPEGDAGDQANGGPGQRRRPRAADEARA